MANKNNQRYRIHCKYCNVPVEGGSISISETETDRYLQNGGFLIFNDVMCQNEECWVNNTNGNQQQNQPTPSSSSNFDFEYEFYIKDVHAVTAEDHAMDNPEHHLMVSVSKHGQLQITCHTCSWWDSSQITS